MKNNNLEKGVAIYLVVIIVSALLAVSLNIASIIIGGTKLVSNYADSVKAFYAADTGIEHVLYDVFISTNCSGFSNYVDTENKYSYEINISGDCSSGTTITSIGKYMKDGINMNSSRRISISY